LKVMTVPLALNSTDRAPSTAVSTASLTVAVEARAAALCEATVRFQMSS
jgi:hypothetical protein